MRPMRGSYDIADTVLRICAIALPALLPFFFIPFAWATVAQAKLLLIALIVIAAAIAWGARLYRDGPPAVPRSILVGTALSLPVAYTISALFAGGGAGSFVSGTGEQSVATSMWLLFGVLCIPYIAYDDVETAFRSTVRAFASGALALIVLQFLHLIFPHVILGIFTGSATSAFGSWHDLGILAGLLVLLAVFLWGSKTAEGLWSLLFVSIGILSLILVTIVNLQDVWFVLAAALAALSAYSFTSSHNLYRSLGALVIAAMCFAGALGGPFIYSHLPSSMQVLQAEVRPSWSMTFSIQKREFSTARTTLVGTGPNSFDEAWGLYKPEGINSTDYWNVDFSAGSGFIPTAFATVGVLGMLAWLSVAIVFFMASWKLVRPLRGEFEEGPALAFAVLYLLVFHVMYVPGIALSAATFFLLGLVALGVSSIPQRSYRADPRAGMVRAGVYALLSFALFISGIYALRADVSYMFLHTASSNYASTGSLDAALVAVDRSLRIYPDNDAAQRAAVTLGLQKMRQLAGDQSTDPTATTKLESTISTAINHALSAVQIGSREYQNWLAIADLYSALGGAGVTGAYDNAKVAYQRAHETDPSNPIPLLSLAQIAYAQHTPSVADELIRQALELKPDLAAGYMLRARMEVDRKDFAAAEEDAQTATKYASGDAATWYTLASVYFAEGGYERAIPALQSALSIQSSDVASQYLLGLSYGHMGDSKQALALLVPIARANPTSSDLQQLIANIQSGRGINAGSATSSTSTITKKH